jgi:2-C-methyl-D-erythritol 4-phosphate cytidylyltransferase
MSSLRYWLVLPAAGRGKRLGSATPKQYLTLAGRSVLEWALQPFLQDPHCEAAVIAVSAEDSHWRAVRSRLGRPVHEVEGGAERSDSVLAALRRLKEMGVADQEWVLVHDAARPCVSTAEVSALCQAVWQTESEGGLLALPLADTLKRGSLQAGQVYAEGTPSREGLWRALTPQMFRLGTLLQAIEAARVAGRVPTDEAQAMEWQGVSALLVAGEATNIKVTTPSDLTLVEGVLSQRMGLAP